MTRGTREPKRSNQRLREQILGLVSTGEVGSQTTTLQGFESAQYAAECGIREALIVVEPLLLATPDVPMAC
jgi:hypothetical protein